jgi:GTP-binding protein
MHHIFLDWRLSRGEVPHRNAGVMVANMAGTANAYSMFNLQDRGTMFVGAGDVVYEGQVVAEHCRDNDVVVNIIKGKQLTNFRTTSSDDALLIKPPRKMTLEQALEYIEDDELVEVTPSAVRLRKAILGESDRRRHERGRTKKSA